MTQSVPLQMVVRNWYDLDEVQDILAGLNDSSLIEMFSAPPPSQDTVNSIAEVYTEYQMLKITLASEIQSECAQGNQDYL